MVVGLIDPRMKIEIEVTARSRSAMQEASPAPWMQREPGDGPG